MKIECPNCSQRYEIELDYLGTPIECKVCNTVFEAKLAVKSLSQKEEESKPNLREVTRTLKISKDNIWKNWK